MNREDNTVAGTDDVEGDTLPDEQTEDTVVLGSNNAVDNVGDISVEINIEELVARIESDNGDDKKQEGAVRRQLDDLIEHTEKNTTARTTLTSTTIWTVCRSGLLQL